MEKRVYCKNPFCEATNPCEECNPAPSGAWRTKHASEEALAEKRSNEQTLTRYVTERTRAIKPGTSISSKIAVEKNAIAEMKRLYKDRGKEMYEEAEGCDHIGAPGSESKVADQSWADISTPPAGYGVDTPLGSIARAWDKATTGLDATLRHAVPLPGAGSALSLTPFQGTESTPGAKTLGLLDKNLRDPYSSKSWGGVTPRELGAAAVEMGPVLSAAGKRVGEALQGHAQLLPPGVAGALSNQVKAKMTKTQAETTHGISNTFLDEVRRHIDNL